MDSLETMLLAGQYLPRHVQLWMTWMQLVLIGLPCLLVYWRTPRILIAAQLLNFALAYLVFRLEGDEITRLYGLGHVFWIWPGVLFVRDAGNKILHPAYRVYAVLAAATILISLLFDSRDVVLWLMGERGSILLDTSGL